MYRLLLEKLKEWKQKEKRKPLILNGARQVGKTYLLENIFGKKYFNNVHKFDFFEDKTLSEIFNETLDPLNVISLLEIKKGKKIDLENDLIFFDEIGECQSALDSLKYFAEKTNIYLCASGSNIGLINSFPVGKTNTLEIYPMNFKEFLFASDEKLLIEAFEKKSTSQIVYDKLWNLLMDYFFVGGMPEAVKTWHSHEKLVDKIESVNEVHYNLVQGYLRDFGKYSGKENAMHLESVFMNIPGQLQKVLDDSVKRFEFKGVIDGKKRYANLRGPIDWLEKAKLISKNHIITSKPEAPLRSLIKENIFKLFFFDLGILNSILEMNYQEIHNQNNSYRGYVAENFIQNELIVKGLSPTYSWSERNSEIEFILKNEKGEFIPLEVKSSSKTRAKSLDVYKDKYAPGKVIKLTGSNSVSKGNDIIRPLYFIDFIYEFLNE